jgi:hypothetical protein
MNLSTVSEMLEHSLRSMSFGEDEVLVALATAKAEKSADLGHFPGGDPNSPMSIHAIMMYDDDGYAYLSIVIPD